MILRHGMTLAFVGLAIGLIGGVGVGYTLNAAFQMPVFDPITFLIVSAILLVVTFLATLVPARRASHVDPMIALRWE